MRGQENVGVHRLQPREAGAVVRHDLRIGRVVGQRIARHADRAEEHHLVRRAAVIQRHGPGGATLGVARRDVRRQGDTAQSYRLAVVYRMINFHRWCIHLGGGSEGDVTAFQDRFVCGTGIKAGAGISLQPCQSTGMIEMRVAVEQYLHIAQLEAQRLDIPFDNRRAFGQPAIR